MKKTFLILMTLFMTMSQAQEVKQIPMINVSGEGKIKTVPDQASIYVSVAFIGAIGVKAIFQYIFYFFMFIHRPRRNPLQERLSRNFHLQ